MSCCLGVCHNTKCQWRRHCQASKQPTNPGRVQPDTERVWRGHVYVVCTELGVVLLSGCLSQHKVSVAAALPSKQATNQPSRSAFSQTRNVWGGDTVCTELFGRASVREP